MSSARARGDGGEDLLGRRVEHLEGVLDPSATPTRRRCRACRERSLRTPVPCDAQCAAPARRLALRSLGRPRGRRGGRGRPRAPRRPSSIAIAHIAERVSLVALPTCGVSTTLGAASSASLTCGSSSKTSSPAPPSLPRPRARRRGRASSSTGPRAVLIDDRPPRQQREPAAVEQVARRGRERDVEADGVGARAEARRGPRRSPPHRWRAGVVPDRPSRRRPPATATFRRCARSRRGRGACRRGRARARTRRRSRVHPPASEQVHADATSMAARREQEGHREVRRRGVEHAGRVAHRDAESRRGLEVDVVLADRDVRDDPERGCARVQDRLVDDVAEQADDAHRRREPRRSSTSRSGGPSADSRSTS